MSTQPADKVTLVTGASRGLGAAISARLAADGAAVVITYGASAERAVADIVDKGGRAVAVHADAADTDAARHAVTTAVRAFGRLDRLGGRPRTEPPQRCQRPRRGSHRGNGGRDRQCRVARDGRPPPGPADHPRPGAVAPGVTPQVKSTSPEVSARLGTGLPHPCTGSHSSGRSASVSDCDRSWLRHLDVSRSAERTTATRVRHHADDRRGECASDRIDGPPFPVRRSG